MEQRSLAWLNIDTPTKRVTLHALGCRHEINKHETPNKGINHLKRDGGWLGFTSRDEAQEYAARTYGAKGFAIVECNDCRGSG